MWLCASMTRPLTLSGDAMARPPHCLLSGMDPSHSKPGRNALGVAQRDPQSPGGGLRLVGPVVGLLADEVQRIAAADLVAHSVNVEDDAALQYEDQFFAGMNEGFGAAVRARFERGDRRGTAERRVRAGNPGQVQSLVWREDRGPLPGTGECDRL